MSRTKLAWLCGAIYATVMVAVALYAIDTEVYADTKFLPYDGKPVSVNLHFKVQMDEPSAPDIIIDWGDHETSKFRAKPGLIIKESTSHEYGKDGTYRIVVRFIQGKEIYHHEFTVSIQRTYRA